MYRSYSGFTAPMVVAPASSTDNAVVRYDGATGNLIQDSGVIVDDSNNVSGVNDLTVTGDINALAKVGSPTYSTLQENHNTMQSAGAANGNNITDAGSGQINIPQWDGWLRSSDSVSGTLYAVTISALSGQSLTDNSVNYVYADYNSGSPQFTITTTKETTDFRTKTLVGTVYREGTTLHIDITSKFVVGDHSGLMVRRCTEIKAIERASGAMISETGTRNIAISASVLWGGLTRVTTSAFDSSAAGTFSYYYRDGLGGWTEVTSQTQIDNTQYDDGSGTLATLTASHYGVHWVYLGTDGHVYVVYGQGDYTSSSAYSAQALTSLPAEVDFKSLLVGKIIIQKSASSFNATLSPFISVIELGATTDHGTLAGLTDDDHSQYALLAGRGGDTLNIDTINEVTPANGVVIDGVTVKDGDLDFLARIGSPTYYTLQHMQNLFHSSGSGNGSNITDGGSGTIDIPQWDGWLRSSDSVSATLYFVTIPASAGVSLTDNSNNFIYADYNGGSPTFTVTTTEETTDYRTKTLVGTVFRTGTSVSIDNAAKFLVGDHAGLMVRRMNEVQPYAHASGAIISETGTRNIALTAGVFWEGLTRFTTSAFDSSVADTFSYYYRDGVGGWTEVASSTQINNTQYDNGSGTLATLSNNKYGVHWVYLGTDSDVRIVYGQGDYTLSEANDASTPSSLPPIILSHYTLAGKIIILKSASTFTSTLSAFEASITTGVTTDHGDLTGLSDDDHSQYALLAGRGGDTLNMDTINEATTDNGVVIETITLKDGNLTVPGNLQVDGITTTINTATLDVEDANITVNNGGNQSTANTNVAGITVEMSDATDARIGYDSTTTSKFKCGEVGSEAEIVTVSASQTLSTKTLTSPVLNTGVSGTAVKDEDDMASNSATHICTQQSIKAYSDSATQTMTNKTLTSPVLNTSVSGTAIKDEDDMTSNSATHLATQQSIKAYVDAEVAPRSVRNYIINGNFDHWQRGTSQASGTSGYGCADRFNNIQVGGTRTVSRQTFTAGQTDVPNNPDYFCRTDITVATSAISDVVRQNYKIENVSTLSGKNVTLSFWAKADSSKNIATEYVQYFGSGGASTVEEIDVTTHNLTTSWQHIILNTSIPSISGKSPINAGNYLAINFFMSAGSNFNANCNSLGHQTGTFDIAHVELFEGTWTAAQIEALNGYQYVAGNVYDELKLCQRYSRPVRLGSSGAFAMSQRIQSYSANDMYISFPLQGNMRTVPTMPGGTGTETTDWVVLNMTGTQQSGFTLTTNTLAQDSIQFKVSKTTHGLTDGSLAIKTQTLYLEAEL